MEMKDNEELKTCMRMKRIVDYDKWCKMVTSEPESTINGSIDTQAEIARLRADRETWERILVSAASGYIDRILACDKIEAIDRAISLIGSFL